MNELLKWILTIILLYLSYIDIQTMYIERKGFILFVIVVCMYMFKNPMPFTDVCLGLLLALGLESINSVVTPVIGQGDIEILIVCSFLFGKMIYLVFVIAVFIGSIHGLVVKIQNQSRKNIPFCPSLVFGILLTLFYGDTIVSAYSFYLGCYII